jgi:4-amino-4-deoxy-L-arabinose transferase-like glycosyltransferase
LLVLLEQAPREEPLQATIVPVPTLAATRRRQARQWIMLALLFITAVKQVILAMIYPPFQGHDEVAHLGYLWVLDQYRRWPTLQDNLPDALSAYSRFTLDWPALYTAFHPPLYYVLAWPVYHLAGDDFLSRLYGVRLVAIPFFLMTVWLTYALSTTLFPRDDFLALTAPSVIAFQPQLGFEGAIVSNDMLSIFFGALLLYLGIVALRHGLNTTRAAVLGLALGLGLLSKATLLVFVPLVGGMALWSCWPRPWNSLRQRDYWRATLGAALALTLPALVLPLPWYLLLKHLYGDFTAVKAVDLLQAGWNVPTGSFGELLGSKAFLLERIHEAWGYFGWKLLPLSQGELFVVIAGLLLCGFGLLVGLGRLLATRRLGRGGGQELLWARDLPVERTQVAGIVFLLAASLLMYGAVIYYGTLNTLTQARYSFPAAPAMALLAMLGLRALVPRPLLHPAAALTIAAVAGFNLFLLATLVFPYAFP